MNPVCFNETYDILCHMELNEYKKIPKSFLEFLRKNRQEDYKVNINYSKSINDQKLQKDTRVLLSLIYRSYICSSEERRTLEEKDKNELQKIEQKKKELYNPDNLFKSNKKVNIQNETKQLIKYKKENFIQKILNKIKEFFGGTKI